LQISLEEDILKAKQVAKKQEKGRPMQEFYDDDGKGGEDKDDDGWGSPSKG